MGRMTEQAFYGIKTRSECDGYAESGNAAIYKLINHVEAIELELKVSKEDEREAVRKYGESQHNIDRLAENIRHLKAENCALETQMNEAREPKKVVLPKEVAEALDNYRAEGLDADYIIRVLSQETPISPLKRLTTIKKFAADRRGYDLIAALVNGYTVEQTKEDRLREGVEQIVREWFRNKASSPIKDVAGDIADFVTKFNADNG